MSLPIAWGDVATWATGAAATVGIVVTIRAQRKTNDAAQRPAAVAEREISDQRQAAAETRQSLSDAEQPWPQLVLQRGTGEAYLLRNIGSAIAIGVTIDRRNLAPETGKTPAGIALRPQESAKMILLGSLGRPLPDEIWVTWDGQNTPVALPMPT